MRLVSRLTLSAAFALSALISSAVAAPPAGYVYVGDYSGNHVGRFDAATGAVVDMNFINLPHVEGMGGTNDVLAVASADGYINLYNVTGPAPVLISQVNNICALQIAFANDGKSFYAAASYGIYQFDTLAGTQLGYVGLPGAPWGVAVNPVNGNVYATNDWYSTSNAAVYNLDFANSTYSGVVTPNTNGNTSLAGITFTKDGSEFFVVNGGNAANENAFVSHYKADGTYLGMLDTAPGGVVGSWNVGDAGYANNIDPLYGAFQAELGPDGNLYVASQNNACAVKFDLTNNTWSTFIPNLPAETGLLTAKTLHFTANNVDVSVVPEPGAVAFGVLAGGSLLGLIARRRKA